MLARHGCTMLAVEWESDRWGIFSGVVLERKSWDLAGTGDGGPDESPPSPTWPAPSPPEPGKA